MGKDRWRIRGATMKLGMPTNGSIQGKAIIPTGWLPVGTWFANIGLLGSSPGECGPSYGANLAIRSHRWNAPLAILKWKMT
ncbi:hypothetical protein [Sphingobacterium sp.]|uniref:hypothetical protein n=1 Tax=Sphingobacterium sp. TaxID=341027 RepID=UPI0028AA3697|nr:hypothetical protein [Sphingobacterium sp.]